MKAIYRLHEVDKTFNDIVGKKCANLGEMAQLGLPVPPGFVLSLDAYEQFMEESNAKKAIKEYLDKTQISPNDLSFLNTASSDLRSILLSHQIPSDMKKSLEENYAELCTSSGAASVPVSVRSAGAKSRPGQYETYLNLNGTENVIHGIKKVWASTFNTRSLSFRLQNALPLESNPIGVAVIKMVNAKCAGVALTVDPNDGDLSKILIESNWGLGESVVSGEITPDLHVINKYQMSVMKKHAGNKIFGFYPNGNGIKKYVFPEEQANSFSISEEEAIGIAELCVALEKHFGVPQDIEWAIDEEKNQDANIYLLQARPAVYNVKESNTSVNIMEKLFNM